MTDQVIADLIVGESVAIRRVRALVCKVAATDLPVLIQGPTGAGKELVAQALHSASRCSGPLVAFNSCAIAETMFEDALFGHVRGAYTGAHADALGLLTEAHLGIAFFDEVSGLPLSLQAKLLRAIETKEYRPVGSRRDTRSDFRVVAATNEPLALLVERGMFRPDLAYRLGGIIIDVPPLRDRVEDIPLLADYFAARFCARHHCHARLGPDAITCLQDWNWPGNVRELGHAVESAIVLADRAMLNRDDIIRVLTRRAADAESNAVLVPGSSQFAKERLLSLLREFNWNAGTVAEHLGVHRVTIYRRMRRLGLRTPEHAWAVPSEHSQVIADESSDSVARYAPPQDSIHAMPGATSDLTRSS